MLHRVEICVCIDMFIYEWLLLIKSESRKKYFFCENVVFNGFLRWNRLAVNCSAQTLQWSGNNSTVTSIQSFDTNIGIHADIDVKIRPTPTLWPIPLFGRTSFFSNLSWWPSLCTAGWQVVANESPVPSGTPPVATPATLATPLGGNPSHPPPPPWIPPEAAKIKHCSIISRVCHLWKQEKKTLSKMLNLFWSVVI